METENQQQKSRQPSSRRLRFNAQTKVFEDRYGGLEDVRKTLGLRPSQICEILKVHPSAWIRWTRGKQPAPPHIYQMLEWYIELLRWRGQHHIFKDQGPVEQRLSLQDPKTYVPPQPSQESSQEKSLGAIATMQHNLTFQKRRLLIFWTLTWALQIGIWLVIGLVIAKFKS